MLCDEVPTLNDPTIPQATQLDTYKLKRLCVQSSSPDGLNFWAAMEPSEVDAQLREYFPELFGFMEKFHPEFCMGSDVLKPWYLCCPGDEGKKQEQPGLRVVCQLEAINGHLLDTYSKQMTRNKPSMIVYIGKYISRKYQPTHFE
jgi:hypothetical protein